MLDTLADISWRCYRHRSGAIGLSRTRSAKELCRKLVRRCYAETQMSYWGSEPQEPYYRLKDEFKTTWTSHLIVTKNERSRKHWYEYWFYASDELRTIRSSQVGAAVDLLAGHLERLW